MNQRFTVRAVIEYHVWPTKDDVSSSTVESCARARVQGVLERAMPGSTVISTTVVEEIPLLARGVESECLGEACRVIQGGGSL